MSIHRLILNTDQIKCDNSNDLVDTVDMDDFKREYKKYLNKKLIDNHRFQLEKEKRERDRLKFIKIRNNMKINNFIYLFFFTGKVCF